MNATPSTPSASQFVRLRSWIQLLLRNWLSLAGLVMIVASLFAFLFLFILDLLAGSSNPYVGILTYLVAPAFTTLGVLMTLFGVILKRRAVRKAGQQPASLVIDFSRSRDRRVLGALVAGGVGFLFITALGSYHSYQFTESVTFCGQACHTVMKPERVTYQNSPHARVSCVECHIGPGATWFVRSKLSGLYQVYATAADVFPRPIPTPIRDLRPAQDTCEQCHWPQKFSGDLVRTYRHFLSDETNTPYSVRVMLKVGGGDPTQGPVGGIHWHTSRENKVEYIATDALRQEIPWVRLTDEQGRVTEFRTPDFTNAVSAFEIRTMDCMDCHNRPAHIFAKPNDAVDRAIAMGRIDRTLPSIRANAAAALTEPYETEEAALAQIAVSLAAEYPDDPRLDTLVAAVQDIYRQSFFPEMKASWRDYPENIGHKDWPGCVRCHDDNHASADGQRAVTFSDCHSCHLILAQGGEEALNQVNMAGQPFAHPVEEYDPAFRCHDCHTGGP